MIEVGAYEAKTRLSALLDEVAGGETVTITKHGRPVALLMPVDATFGTPLSEVLLDLDRHRTPRREGDSSIKQMVGEGR